MRRPLLYLFIAAQIGVPGTFFVIRLVTGFPNNPWGWQMFS